MGRRARKRAPRAPSSNIVITISVLLDGDAVLDVLERRTIMAALAECGGNVTTAAALLGIHRQVLQRKMRRLALR